MSEFWKTLLDALVDTLLDTLKVAPFCSLYIAYGFIEHKAGDKTKNFISRSADSDRARRLLARCRSAAFPRLAPDFSQAALSQRNADRGVPFDVG
jgi:hypothetical protein